MNIDTMLLEQGNFYNWLLRNIGSGYAHFSNMLRLNPFFSSLSGDMEKYGRFLTEKGMHIGPSRWHTENQVVFSDHKVALRKFNENKIGNPIVFVAPEAGHNSQIVDYGPEQSLVECAKNYYAGDIYVAEKLPAGPRDTEYSLDDSMKALYACINYIGEPVNLVGLCQGGWQSAIFTALFPESVKTLTLAAAPIDFQKGDGPIKEWVASLPMSYFESLIGSGNGNMPGSLIVFGFMMMNAADRFFGDDILLYKHIDDPEFISRRKRFDSWYKLTQSVPGKLYRETVKSLFIENKLVKGDLVILGRKVDLSKINQPVYLIAGTKDDITPPAQLFALKDHISSPPVTEMMVRAGHIGVFMAKNVIKDYWSPLLTELNDLNPQLKDIAP
jgi:poly(3-hydroxybutyrate) depolymerase